MEQAGLGILHEKVGRQSRRRVAHVAVLRRRRVEEGCRGGTS